MTNVIGLGEVKGRGTEYGCWLCQKGVSARALFCHHCGTIQPVRPVDYFARLGMERRVDLDLDLLERQFLTLCKALDPNRFALRGSGERGHAARQMEALIDAYETLRDPVRRGRYWLVLHQQDFEDAQTAHPVVTEMRLEFDKAGSTADLDRIAQRAGQAFEDCIMRLLQSLRDQNWQIANATLLELDGMEGILDQARARRGELAGKKD